MTDWREIAWNGIRFNAPAEWEIGSIGLRYVVLEFNHEPILEIKWAPVKGRFSHKAHLRRLSAGHKRRLRKTFRKTAIPTAWEDALARFETTGFTWKSESTSAQGAILFCPTCRTATLLQVYNPEEHARSTAVTRLLTSLSDHEPEQLRRWSVFDIKAAVPEDYQLKQYRFHAGEFRLDFNCKPQQLSLFRWSPAEILIPDKDLVRYARSTGLLPEADRWAVHTEDPLAISGELPEKKEIISRVMRRLKRQVMFGRFRLWHLENRNRLLCVRLVGRRPIDTDLFQEICQNYHVV